MTLKKVLKTVKTDLDNMYARITKLRRLLISSELNKLLEATDERKKHPTISKTRSLTKRSPIVAK